MIKAVIDELILRGMASKMSHKPLVLFLQMFT